MNYLAIDFLKSTALFQEIRELSSMLGRASAVGLGPTNRLPFSHRTIVQ